MDFMRKIKTQWVNGKFVGNKYSPPTPPTQSSTPGKMQKIDSYKYVRLNGFPIDGWIHGCIVCTQPTTRIEELNKTNAYICPKCTKIPRQTKLAYLHIS